MADTQLGSKRESLKEQHGTREKELRKRIWDIGLWPMEKIIGAEPGRERGEKNGNVVKGKIGRYGSHLLKRLDHFERKIYLGGEKGAGRVSGTQPIDGPKKAMR